MSRNAIPGRPDRRRASSTRVRILGWYIAILGISLLLSLILFRSILLDQLSDDIDHQLRQEVAELEQLSTGRNPNTGEPFGDDIAAIFDTFLSRNVPLSGEAFYTFLEGRPYASSITAVRLFDEAEIVGTWSAITQPTQAEINSAGGRVRYLAVPVVGESGGQGLFVVAHHLDESRTQLERTFRTGALIFGGVFAIVSVASWFAAGRVLRPISLLTEAAREVEETNWSERIPVAGDDEIAQLARTFNEMLDRLEEAFVSQRRFIDDASHELRTPITIVRGNLEVMGDDPADWAEVKPLVMDELDRMGRMVEDLLLLARSEHPAFLDPHPIDVQELTREIADKIAALSAERTWEIADSASVVMVADRDRLTQALMNLARNAVEHSAPGSRITLGSRCDGSQVLFWIQDEGEGIPEEEREQIFERFSRGRPGMRRTDGAGLGLAIVKTIAEAHGGRITVESAPREGSVFRLVLPIDGPQEGR
ncbi:MAG: sensor histidine kinase [Anaerolineae bacterium]|jgi:signal transduction histidine kinase